MPRYLGGDMTEITCNHPSLGNFKFATKSNESYNIDPGGFRAADDANMVTGNGTNVNQINRVRWAVEGPLMLDFDSQNETTGLADLAADPEDGVWTFTHISGVVWKGTGRPVGDLSGDTNTAQMATKISGGGKLEKL